MPSIAYVNYLKWSLLPRTSIFGRKISQQTSSFQNDRGAPAGHPPPRPVPKVELLVLHAHSCRSPSLFSYRENVATIKTVPQMTGGCVVGVWRSSYRHFAMAVASPLPVAVALAWPSCPSRGVPRTVSIQRATTLLSRPLVRHLSAVRNESYRIKCQCKQSDHYNVLDSHHEDGSCLQVRRYDAIMVLGGGLTSNGGIPEWVIRRLDGAFQLYKQQERLDGQRACQILLLGAGTPHKPPVLDTQGYVLHESTVYAEYLLKQGVPPSDLLKETSSYDTVGNAYFSLTMHVLPAGWRQLAVVTSEFHMPRTMQTFKDCYALASQSNVSLQRDIKVDYFAVSDENLFAQDVLEARKEKEAIALSTWKQNFETISSLPKLHSWLFATHLCYSVSRQHEFGRVKELDPRLAATY
jgi:hypothetical protein